MDEIIFELPDPEALRKEREKERKEKERQAHGGELNFSNKAIAKAQVNKVNLLFLISVDFPQLLLQVAVAAEEEKRHKKESSMLFFDEDDALDHMMPDTQA